MSDEPTLEDRLAALEGKVVHIEEQIGALETDVKRFKEKEAASAESGPSTG